MIITKDSDHTSQEKHFTHHTTQQKKQNVSEDQKQSSLKLHAEASLRSFAMSPQKVNLVLQLIRKTSVIQALRILKFCPKKKASASVSCLIQSALSNGQNKYGLQRENWVVDEIYCAPARPIKSVIFHAKGKTGRCYSRRSHVFVSLRGER
jgi:large subunit ribosomal protein L22